MKISRWPAVAVTALFVLMNLGAAADPEQTGWVRVGGGVLGLIGLVAAAALARNLPWGRAAVIGAGVLNACGAVAALVADEEGFVPGIVVAGLGILFGALAGGGTAGAKTPAASAS